MVGEKIFDEFSSLICGTIAPKGTVSIEVADEEDRRNQLIDKVLKFSILDNLTWWEVHITNSYWTVKGNSNSLRLKCGVERSMTMRCRI